MRCGIINCLRSMLCLLIAYHCSSVFEYSSTYIQFLAFLKIGFKISYRTVQGIVRGLSDYISRIEEIHFTQIRRRIIKVKPSVGNLNLDNDNDDNNDDDNDDDD